MRWGGEEFLVILTNTNQRNAKETAERMRRCVESECNYGDIRVTASFGVAQWKTGQSVDALLQTADVRLYAAKEKGRNRVE